MVKLKELRESSKVTQKEIANILGITQTCYSYYENGKTKIGIEELKILSKFYNVPIDYIVGNMLEAYTIPKNKTEVQALFDQLVAPLQNEIISEMKGMLIAQRKTMGNIAK